MILTQLYWVIGGAKVASHHIQRRVQRWPHPRGSPGAYRCHQLVARPGQLHRSYVCSSDRHMGEPGKGLGGDTFAQPLLFYHNYIVVWTAAAAAKVGERLQLTLRILGRLQGTHFRGHSSNWSTKSGGWIRCFVQPALDWLMTHAAAIHWHCY